MEKILNYINGVFTGPAGGTFFDNINPATGRVYSYVPDSDERDVEAAAAAAEKAFPSWASRPARERSEILERIAALIERDKDNLALAESVDQGKTIASALALDIPRAAANLRFFAGAILHFSSAAHQTDNAALNYTAYSPVGVVGCISPWNLPLYLFTWKIAPALASGCTVVAKPSELSPMTAFLFCSLCDEAGLPPGVLNVVHGYGHKAGQAIVDHPLVQAISFTGGTETGKKIAASAAPRFRKLSLELGGKNPNIIFADADMEEAVRTTVLSSFSNQGEICLCGSRIFVERSAYDSFLAAFIEQTRKLVVGDPRSSQVNVGALISHKHMEKVLGYIELAKKEGGEVVCGGKQLQPQGDCSTGFFVEPTIITGLSHSCRTNLEEIFGPVVTIAPFDSEDEVVAWANAPSYGLSATIWTQNLNRAHKVSARIKAGVIWINCWLLRDLRTPFGGMKQSGVGREGGFDALRFFMDTKNICIRL